MKDILEIEDLSDFLKDSSSLYATELLTGQVEDFSITRKSSWVCKVLEYLGYTEDCYKFSVYPDSDSSRLISDRYEIEEQLRLFCVTNTRSLLVQGKMIGPKVLGNRYRRANKELYIFEVFDIDQDRRLNLEEKQAILNAINLPLVPFVMVIGVEDLLKKDNPKAHLIALAVGDSRMTLTPPFVRRTGLVFRDPLDEDVGFKVEIGDKKDE